MRPFFYRIDTWDFELITMVIPVIFFSKGMFLLGTLDQSFYFTYLFLYPICTQVKVNSRHMFLGAQPKYHSILWSKRVNLEPLLSESILMSPPTTVLNVLNWRLHHEDILDSRS